MSYNILQNKMFLKQNQMSPVLLTIDAAMLLTRSISSRSGARYGLILALYQFMDFLDFYSKSLARATSANHLRDPPYHLAWCLLYHPYAPQGEHPYGIVASSEPTFVVSSLRHFCAWELIPSSRCLCLRGAGFLLEPLSLLRSWLPPWGTITLEELFPFLVVTCSSHPLWCLPFCQPLYQSPYRTALCSLEPYPKASPSILRPLWILAYLYCLDDLYFVICLSQMALYALLFIYLVTKPLCFHSYLAFVALFRLILP